MKVAHCERQCNDTQNQNVRSKTPHCSHIKAGTGSSTARGGFERVVERVEVWWRYITGNIHSCHGDRTYRVYSKLLTLEAMTCACKPSREIVNPGILLLDLIWISFKVEYVHRQWRRIKSNSYIWVWNIAATSYRVENQRVSKEERTNGPMTIPSLHRYSDFWSPADKSRPGTRKMTRVRRFDSSPRQSYTWESRWILKEKICVNNEIIV